MSVSKTSTNVLQIGENDLLIISKAKQIASEVNSLNTDLIGNVEPIECVAQSIEEITVLKEMRMSKYNYRLERIKTLKRKVNKSLL